MISVPILSWQNKVKLEEYQRWIQNVERDSSDYGSIENIIFLLQNIFLILSLRITLMDYDEENEVTKISGKQPKWLLTLLAKLQIDMN